RHGRRGMTLPMRVAFSSSSSRPSLLFTATGYRYRSPPVGCAQIHQRSSRRALRHARLDLSDFSIITPLLASLSYLLFFLCLLS
ncbi:hypothetical protein PFISCL1PPCAC_15343, partial [Pristionchus fissidentatus]